jgi:hypothetical protein
VTQDQKAESRAVGAGHVREAPLEGLTEVAKQTLDYFEDAAATAAAELAGGKGASSDVFASVNTLTGTETQNLSDIREDARRNLEAVIAQPAIARVEVLNNEGKREVIFITPAGAPRARWGEVRIASYRSPVGRLAAIPIGHDLDVRTPGTPGVPGRPITYELVGRARLNPVPPPMGWDSRNTVVEPVTGPPFTVVSLRELLRSPTEDDGAALALLESLLAKGAQAQNVFEGLRRTVIERMGLRERPLLDQYQDEIFRLPLDNRIAILGPPGSGKTTTLIKRLGMKLDLQAEEDELAIIDRTRAGRRHHATSWLMFSPTELLRQYVKEAFNREGVPAPDPQIQVWDAYRRETARNRLGILRSTTSRGSILKDGLQNLQGPTIADQVRWYQDFDAWQKQAFWVELGEHAARLAGSEDRRIVALGARLAGIVEAGVARDGAAPFVEFRASSRIVGDHSRALQDEVELKLRSAFAHELQKDEQLLDKLVAFLGTLGESADATDDVDEADTDEDDEDTLPLGRAAIDQAFDAYLRATRAHARALASGRRLGARSRHAQVVSWLGEHAPRESDMKALGTSVLLAASLRRLANPMRAYLSGIPRRYRRFRRVRSAEGVWYEKTQHGPMDVGPLELDMLILAMLRTGRMLLSDPRIASVVDEASITSLQAIRDLSRTQVVVDEATDFSPVQLACMSALCDPAADSFVACGDFNQRITSWGTRSEVELRWVLPDIQIRRIRVTYRHSRQLNALAHQIARLTGDDHESAVLPAYVDNEGVDPVLGIGLAGKYLAAWLKARIVEIERLTQILPSIAVLVNRETEVQPMAEALQAALSDANIPCSACPGGLVRGNESEVRVFDIQHIKGLEFEAVFFVGVDELAAAKPDLFDKFLYVDKGSHVPGTDDRGQCRARAPPSDPVDVWKGLERGSRDGASIVLTASSGSEPPPQRPRRRSYSARPCGLRK